MGSTSTPAPSSSAGKPSKTSSVKRERSVPPEKQQEKDEAEDEATSDTELMGSPKKRKKTGLFDGHLLEKVAGVGKDVWSMGSKLSNSIFKPKKVEAETAASTPCEATTSHQDDKACSSSSSSIATSKPKAVAEHEDGDLMTKRREEGKR